MLLRIDQLRFEFGDSFVGLFGSLQRRVQLLLRFRKLTGKGGLLLRINELRLQLTDPFFQLRHFPGLTGLQGVFPLLQILKLLLLRLLLLL